MEIEVQSSYSSGKRRTLWYGHEICVAAWAFVQDQKSGLSVFAGLVT